MCRSVTEDEVGVATVPRKASSRVLPVVVASGMGRVVPPLAAAAACERSWPARLETRLGSVEVDIGKAS